MSTDVMKSIYYAYVHTILAYGIIFWGNSCFSDNIFRIQKRIIRVIITNLRKRDSCHELFKKLQILTLQSQYILSLLVFVVKNRSHFILNSDIHDINTRFNQNLHLPFANLTLVQKGVFFLGSKICNQLPSRIKMLYKDLIEHAFYSIDEYYQFTSQ
jgi:hypothetical protein